MMFELWLLHRYTHADDVVPGCPYCEPWALILSVDLKPPRRG